MQTPHELVAGRFEGSVFGLAFETEQKMGYRSGLRNGVLRALHIDLERCSVEYELMERGLPTKSRVEYSPTLAKLVERLPIAIDSFDLKFEGGLRLEEDRASVAQAGQRVRRLENADPWNPANYYDPFKTDKRQDGTRLRFAHEQYK